VGAIVLVKARNRESTQSEEEEDGALVVYI